MPDPRAPHAPGQAAIQPAEEARQHPAVAAIAALALVVATACGGSSPRAAAPALPDPPPVSPAAYAHYLRGRVAFYGGDYLAAVRELRRARRAAPREPELVAALAQAALLYLSEQ